MAFAFLLESTRMRTSVSLDGKLTKTFTDSYLCTNETELTLDAVAAAVGVLPGAPHPDRADATARDFDTVRRMTHTPHCAWDHTITYSTEGTVPESSSSTDPEDRRVLRSTGTTTQQRFIIKDRNGVLIVDTAGSPYDGGIPVTDYLGTIQWTRCEAHSSSSMSQAAQYSGKLNSTTFMTCAAETLMLHVTGQEKYEGTYHFWEFTYTMTYDKDGWQPKPVNAGLYQRVEKSTGGFERQRIMEGTGTSATKTQEPQPLYGSTSSSPIPGSVIPVASRPGSCNFIDVDHYITFDFTTLGLPTT